MNDPEIWGRVLQDYKPNFNDELALIRGTQVKLIRELEPGWWQGEFNGQVRRLGTLPCLIYDNLISCASKVKVKYLRGAIHSELSADNLLAFN